MIEEKIYYYLHENGDLIAKPARVVDTDPEYFNSPFVKKVWMLKTGDGRKQLWDFIVEAVGLGADMERVKHLMLIWGLSFADSFEYLSRFKEQPSDLMVDGFNKIIREVFGITSEQYFDVELKQWYKENCPEKLPSECVH